MERKSTKTTIQSNTSNTSEDRPASLRNHSSDNSRMEPPKRQKPVKTFGNKFRKFRNIEAKIQTDAQFIRQNLYLVPKYLSHCKSLIKAENGHVLNDEIQDVIEYLQNYSGNQQQEDLEPKPKRIKIEIEEDKLVYHLSEKGTIKSTEKQHKVEQNGWDDEIDLDGLNEDPFGGEMQFDTQMNQQLVKMQKLDSNLVDYENENKQNYKAFKSQFFIENMKMIEDDVHDEQEQDDKEEESIQIDSRQQNGVLTGIIGAVASGTQSAVGAVTSGSTQAVGAVLAGSKEAVKGVGSVAISGVQSGVQGVSSGLEKVREAAIGPNEEKLAEIQRQKELEDLKRKKMIVKTPQYLRNKHAISQLEQKMFLSQEELDKLKAKRAAENNAIKSDNRQEADEIEQQMFSVSQGMKEMAHNFKTQIKQDDGVLKSIEQSQEENIKKTEAERQRIAKLQKSTFWGFWTKFITLLSGMVTFVFMLWFIWLFPNKVSHVQSLSSTINKQF